MCKKLYAADGFLSKENTWHFIASKFLHSMSAVFVCYHWRIQRLFANRYAGFVWQVNLWKTSLVMAWGIRATAHLSDPTTWSSALPLHEYNFPTFQRPLLTLLFMVILITIIFTPFIWNPKIPSVYVIYDLLYIRFLRDNERMNE